MFSRQFIDARTQAMVQRHDQSDRAAVVDQLLKNIPRNSVAKNKEIIRDIFQCEYATLYAA